MLNNPASPKGNHSSRLFHFEFVSPVFHVVPCRYNSFLLITEERCCITSLPLRPGLFPGLCHSFPAAAPSIHAFWWPRAQLCLEHVSGSGVSGFQGCARSLFLDTSQWSPAVGPPVHAARSTNGSVCSPSAQRQPLSLPFGHSGCYAFWCARMV